MAPQGYVDGSFGYHATTHAAPPPAPVCTCPAGEEAIDGSRLVAAHEQMLQRWVRRALMRTGMWHLKDDLWVAAALALVNAYQRWDRTRGVSFECFARSSVWGAILDEMRRYDHLPRRLRAHAERARRARDTLRQEHAREPTYEEVCERLPMKRAAIDAATAASGPFVELDETLDVGDAGMNPETLHERAELLAAVSRAMQTLPARQRLVMHLRYTEDRPYREIAERLSISVPRVCQLHARAMEQLRMEVEQ